MSDPPLATKRPGLRAAYHRLCWRSGVARVHRMTEASSRLSRQAGALATELVEHRRRGWKR